MTKSTLEILTGARELLSNGRWYQGDFCDYSQENPCYCALGALAITADEEYVLEYLDQDSFDHMLDGPAEGAFRLLRDVVGGDVPDWNDAGDRTVEQVITAFDAAITLAKNAQ